MVTPAPCCTVVVPTHDRSNSLRRLLDSLEFHVDPDAVEVVVVLDGCRDDSHRVVAGRAMVRPVIQPQQGLAAARNAGAAHARAPLLWFLDDDMEVTAQAAAVHTSAPAERVIRVGPAHPGPSFDQTTATFYDRRHRRLARAGVIDDPFDFSGANTSMASALFAELGGYDPVFRTYGVEDYELAHRALRKGVTLCFEGEAGVVHHGYKPLARRLEEKQSSWRNRAALVAAHPDLAGRVHDDLVRTRTRRVLSRVGSRWLGPVELLRRVTVASAGRVDRLVPGAGRLGSVAMDAAQVVGYCEGQRGHDPRS